MEIYRNKYAIKKAKDILNKEGQVVEVKLDKIYDNPYQPRIEIKEKELEELANSIKEKGLLQPILVFNDKDENKLYLIAGHRRYYAYKLLGKEKIKVIYVNGIEKKDLASIAITENLQREDLDI